MLRRTLPDQLRCTQVDYPLGYWPGVILFHSIYALFEAKRFDNFQKYGEVRCKTSFL